MPEWSEKQHFLILLVLKRRGRRKEVDGEAVRIRMGIQQKRRGNGNTTRGGTVARRGSKGKGARGKGKAWKCTRKGNDGAVVYAHIHTYFCGERCGHTCIHTHIYGERDRQRDTERQREMKRHVT